MAPGSGFALVSAVAGTLSMQGPRRYVPPLREFVPGLVLAGIADSLAVRSAESVLQQPGVRAVSRWDPQLQAWEGRFRIPDGGTAGSSFLIAWGEAVAVESDSLLSWQPSPPDRASLPLHARPALPSGGTSSAMVLRGLGGAGSMDVVWCSPPGGTVRVRGPGGGLVWNGPAGAQGWSHVRLSGLVAGSHRVVLERGADGGRHRLEQRVEVAPSSIPPMPRWLWGPAPSGDVPLLLHGSSGRVLASDAGPGRWYAGAPGPGPYMLEALLDDGGWVRWDLQEDPVDGGMRPTDEGLAISGLEQQEAPRSVTLRWQVLSSNGTLTFQPLLAFPGQEGGGPPGEGRRWHPAGEAISWQPGDLPALRTDLPILPDGRGALPEAAAVRVCREGGRTAWIGPVSLTLQAKVRTVQLLPAVPNPFNPETRIRFRLPAGPDRQVRLEVLDTRGRRVRRLLEARLSPGTYEQVWNGRDGGGHPSAAGVYLVILQVEGRRHTRKVLLLK